MQEDAVKALDNQLKALELRKAGVSYQRIADALGYKSASGAHKAVHTALKKTLQEPADELRTLELARLDDMLKAIAPHVAAGNLTAIDRALKIQERRARLLGLDAPVKQDLTSGGEKINQSISDETVNRAISTLTEALGEIISGKSDKPAGEVDTPK